MIPKNTRYVCPVLMHLSMIVWRVKLRKTHAVTWSRTGDSLGVFARQHNKLHGYEVQCIFPQWAVLLEWKIREWCLRTSLIWR